ncbi:MAG TPA: cell division topological specificity factor MinE [Armatimonadota bacterium]|nr:cell division topological specificity factor MinE [Armatimonadota bacterium]
MGFLITWFGRREKSSSSVAKDRLLEVLIHDRIKLPPATLDQIRQEILEVLSKYIDVDKNGMEVSITRADGGAHLTANIPIRRGEALDLSDDAAAEEHPTPSRANRPAPQAAGRNSGPQSFGPPRKRRH